MSLKEKVITQSHRNTALNVIGVNVTVLTDSNPQKITLQSGVEGAGPPPHSLLGMNHFMLQKALFSLSVMGKPPTVTKALL